MRADAQNHHVYISLVCTLLSAAGVDLLGIVPRRFKLAMQARGSQDSDQGSLHINPCVPEVVKSKVGFHPSSPPHF